MDVKGNERLYMITLDLTYKCNFRCLKNGQNWAYVKKSL